MGTDFSNFKLTIDWKPSAYHYKTVRKSITPTLWKKIRTQVLHDHHYTCSICHYTAAAKADYKKLHVHEVEVYGETELLCTLKDLQLICIHCHAFHHFRRTVSVINVAQLEALKQHFIRVNHCTEDEYSEYCNLIGERIKNSIELPIESPFAENGDVRFRIEGEIPYKNEVIEQLKKKGLYDIE